MAKGRKQCPNCKEVLGVRTIQCDKCGYDFRQKKVTAIVEKQEKPITENMTRGRGKKECPGCHKIVGVRTLQCVCGHDFAATKKTVRKEVMVKHIEDENEETHDGVERPEPKKSMELSISVHAGKEVKKTSPLEHAKRILALGPQRAKILLQQSKDQKWRHVDWKYVAQQLGVTVGAVEEVEAEEEGY